MNSRKYPRTMQQAFPFGPEYACAIEKPSRINKVLDCLFATAIGIALAYGLLVYLT